MTDPRDEFDSFTEEESNDHPTPGSLQDELRQEADELMKMVAAHMECMAAAAQAEYVYRRMYAETWVQETANKELKRTVEDLKQSVILKTVELDLKNNLAAAVARAAGEAVQAQQTRVDCLRSILSSQKAEINTAGYGQT
jgi:vacuolar-type H+-ATPase subunit I/STV1